MKRLSGSLNSEDGVKWFHGERAKSRKIVLDGGLLGGENCGMQIWKG